MKQKNWFKPKAFTHITKKLSLEDEEWIENYVSDKNKISIHKFYPLIHRTIVTKRFKKGIDKNGMPVKRHYTYKNNQKETTAKYREIYYPNHLDAHIYSYYTQKILEPFYEAELAKNKRLNESILAYRKIELPDKSRCKCNIDFANEVFEEIKNFKGETAVLCLDISKFFDSLDHKKLKQAWAKLLGTKDLEKDHYNLFKNLTNFSYVEMKSLLLEFGFNHPNQIIQKDISSFVKSGEEFRNRIKNKGYIKKNPFRRNEANNQKVKIGIPQGTPMSAFLANLYLLGFDKKVLDLLGSYGIYRRYSDDILIICRKNNYQEIENEIYKLIENDFNLIIQPSKTQRTFFFDGRLVKGEKPINYLGFQFDGKRKLLRSSSISKFYRKMKSNVKFRSFRALIAKQKIAKGKSIDNNGLLIDAFLHRKKLYQQFSFLGAGKRSLKKRNYFSYANFAARIMSSPEINNQLSKAWIILHEEIERHELKYDLPTIKTCSKK